MHEDIDFVPNHYGLNTLYCVTKKKKKIIYNCVTKNEDIYNIVLKQRNIHNLLDFNPGFQSEKYFLSTEF